MSNTPNIAEQLQALRVRYAQQLPNKLDELEQSLAQLLAHPSDEETLVTFHRQAHTLTGSGATYGFPSLSQCARELEICLKACLNPPRMLTQQDFAAMRTLLDKVRASTNRHETEPFAEEAARLVAAQEKEKEESPLIYLLDDDPLTLIYLSTQLGNFGYQVVVCATPGALREQLAAKTPSAMLIGVMPDQSVTGPLTAQSLSEETRANVPIVFISDHADFAARLKCVRAGGQGFYLKPLNIDLLADALDRLTRRVAQQPFRILIVEDSQAVALIYSAALENAGMITRIVTDPIQAMATLEEFSPELILMDMYMPDVRGDELAKVIRQQSIYVSIPIVFLSAETDMDKQMAAIRYGGDDFLTKPISLPHLVASVTSRVERYRTLRGFMQRDSLTGLLNHTKSKEFLEAELARAQRAHQPLCFAMIDIDHFKKVNDTYGHPTGDRVIKSLARLLQQRLRKTDAIGRYGGEEFAVIMPNTSVDTAQQILEGLRVAFSQIQHRSKDEIFYTTFSSGVAESTVDMPAAELTAIADRALYQSKHAGRNRITKGTS